MFAAMLRLLAATLIPAVFGVSVLAAQTDYYARLGATFSTALVSDRIINEIEVKQNLAPTLVLGASLPIAPLYRAGLEAAFTTSGYKSEEASVESDLGTLRTGSLTLALEGPVTPNVRWRGGVGLLGYFPSEDRGIFLSGGTTRFLAGAGLDYRRPIMTRWDLMASLRYDFHRFTTGELRARGFSQSQGVQRVSVTLGLARAVR
jgi:hypothetical protein